MPDSSVYRIALVQNQSEMAHYSYADGRHLLSELGYDYRLYTAYDIDELPTQLDDFDAVFLGSLALNDKAIRETLLSDIAIANLQAFAVSGRGILSGHTLGLAQRNIGIAFLPDELGAVRPVPRPVDEHATEGRFAIPTPAQTHFLTQYPEVLAAETLQRNCLEFNSLPGLYWHYWDDIDYSAWDVIIEDGATGRALLLVNKQSLPYNIALSALTLDWQKQRDLLANLLRFITEGTPATAVIVDPTQLSAEFNYLTSALVASGVAVREYDIQSALPLLGRHIRKPIHSSLILGPNVYMKELPDTLTAEIQRRHQDGDLRLLFAAREPDLGFGFSCFDKGSLARELLLRMLLRVKQSMRSGYIDGSFWSTVETLQVLESHPLTGMGLTNHIEPILKLVDEHDRGGSYDEVFGATCAALWLRATYQGVDHDRTKRVVEWLRSRVSFYDKGEQIACLMALAHCGSITVPERARLGSLLRDSLNERSPQLSLISYMRAALAIGETDLASDFAMELCHLLERERWLDLSTASAAAVTLLALLQRVKQGEHVSTKFDSHAVGQLIARTVVSIRDTYERKRKRPNNDEYPWDNKASTSVKCLQAWRLFDESLSGTVYDALTLLRSAATETADRTLTRTALSVLEDLKAESEALEDEVGDLNSQMRGAVSRRYARLSLAALLLLGYLLVSVLVASSFSSRPGLSSLLQTAFIRPWGFHLAVVTVSATLLAVPWERWISR